MAGIFFTSKGCDQALLSAGLLETTLMRYCFPQGRLSGSFILADARG